MRTLEERINGPEAEPWIPENSGEYVIGELEEISDRDGDYGPFKVITLLTEGGDVLNVAGFGTVLKGKFDGLTNDDLGCKIAVKFLGEASNKAGKPYKNWSVTIDRSALVGAAAAVATGNEFGGDE